jgi:TRAP-type C4-dicarboxylate transport system substrate-binding protein
MGTEAWNNLNKQEQRWLSESVTEATDYQRKLWQKSEEEALEAVKAEGVEVIRPDKTEFFEKTKGILESHKNDAKVYDLITRIQSIQ